MAGTAPETVNEIQDQVISESQAKQIVDRDTGGQPVCPSIPEVIYASFPELQVYGDIVGDVVSSAESLGTLAERVLNPPPGSSISQEVGSKFSSLEDKAEKAAQRAAIELKEAAQELAAKAKQEIIDQMNKVQEVVEAIRTGIIDIKTDLENIDQITLDALAKQFPGFKNAIDCKRGGVPGSANRESSVETPVEQADTPAPENVAKIKTDVAKQASISLASISADNSLPGRFGDRIYPFIIQDRNDPTVYYAVYSDSENTVKTFKQVGLQILERPAVELQDLIDAGYDVTGIPQQLQRLNEAEYQQTVGEDAGDPIE